MSDNRASVLDYGQHSALLFIDGVGRTAFAKAHDPVPAGARAVSFNRRLRGDPFSDPSRPLILMLASDCQHLRADIRAQLLGLSRYPGICVVRADGVSDLGFTDPLILTAEADGAEVKISVRPSPEAEVSALFRRLEGSVVGPADLVQEETKTWFDPAILEASVETLAVPPDVAVQLAVEAAAHESSGFDYLVSPGLMTTGGGRAKAWPRMFGACTPDEAIRLAGVKARMYRSVPLVSAPDHKISVNLGMWLDLAVMNFTPGLRRALRAAIAPSASTAEASTADSLLAVRGRLSELLHARDAIYRLVRREALGPDWVRPYDHTVDVSGVSGNDLIAQLAFHLTAILNSSYSAADNLAWVLARRDGVPKSDKAVSFGGLVFKKRRGAAWRDGPVASAGATTLLASRRLPFVLATREVRNALVHAEGVNTGAIHWGPETDAPTRGLSGWWVERTDLRSVDLRDGRTLELFEGLSGAAGLAGPDDAVFTWVKFADRLWQDTAGIIGSVLDAVDWPSASGWRPRLSNAQRTWRQAEQRRLWGM